ncbi:MAG: hypothetical protein Fues2KO_46930 [Fuerstiella sp.]
MHVVRPDNDSDHRLILPDISCCQPLCLNVLLADKIDSGELELHRSLTESGLLYDRIADDLGQLRTDVKPVVMKYLYGPWFDKQPYVCPSVQHIPSIQRAAELLAAVAQWYQETLPGVSTFLKLEKTDKRNFDYLNRDGMRRAGKPRLGYSIVAHRLQQLEADLVVEQACRNLIDDVPELVFTPIHDGILTEEWGKELAEEALRRSFASVGLHPHITA